MGSDHTDAATLEPAAPEPTTSRALDRPLRCMEIWGGNEAVRQHLKVTGMDVWAYSRPFNDLGLVDTVDNATSRLAGTHADGSQPPKGGGDLHYVSTCGAGNIARFVIADVAGHGPSVHDLGIELRKLIRQNINTVDQSALVQALNQAFARLELEGRFATALMATYFAPTDHMVISNAGHPRPLWYRSRERRWRPLHEHGAQLENQVANLPLGVIEHTNYHQFAVHLEPADRLLLFTDALTEAADPDGQMLGEQGLIEILHRIEDQHDPGHHHAPNSGDGDGGQPDGDGVQSGDDGVRPDDDGVRPDGDALLDALLSELDTFRGQNPPQDDTTMVLLEHNASDPQPMPLSERLSVIAKVLGLKRV